MWAKVSRTPSSVCASLHLLPHHIWNHRLEHLQSDQDLRSSSGWCWCQGREGKQSKYELLNPSVVRIPRIYRFFVWWRNPVVDHVVFFGLTGYGGFLCGVLVRVARGSTNFVQILHIAFRLHQTLLHLSFYSSHFAYSIVFYQRCRWHLTFEEPFHLWRLQRQLQSPASRNFTPPQ